jgi:anti-sigma regulatory factor (Ser/Thr protein kinase)
MRAALPTGFHILVWRDGGEILMVFSGRADPGNSADIARAFDPAVCPPGARVILDLEALQIAEGADPLFEDITTRKHEGGAIFVVSAGDMAAAEQWRAPELHPWWQMHSYDLPAASWICNFARARAGEVAIGARLSHHDVDSIKMAVGEAMCNAIKHGCAAQPDSRIRLRCIAGTDIVEVIVSDTGAGFDLDSILRSPAQAPGRGGHGLGIMYRTVDKVEFSFDGGTSVRLIKYLRQGQEANG